MKTSTILFQQEGILGVLQFAIEKANSVEFISSSEAISKNFIEVAEINQSGSVNDIGVLNTSPHFVLFIDGDILVGAKQNRVLNTSVLVSPHSKTLIPVSCIEAGRWQHRSRKFDSSNYSAPISLRQIKSSQVTEGVKSLKGKYANQGAIWNEVSFFERKLEVDSDTSNLSDVFNESESALDKLFSSMKASEGANGVAFFINRKLKNIEIVNRSNIFAEYFPKLLKGISMDAFGMKADQENMTQAEAEYKFVELQDQLKSSTKIKSKGVGVGEELRLDSENIAGHQLIFNGNLIHEAVFVK